jgi:hypothetical protein
MTVEDPSALAKREPLFTTAPTTKRMPDPSADPANPWGPGDGREPEVRLSLVETLMDSMGGPVVELGPAPVGFIQPPPGTLGPRHASRTGMVRDFRHWWRQESLARAAQKRAFAMAETILRSQAARVGAGSVDRAPALAVQTQSLRSMLELTEERFQALGLRSDRVQDELSSIARALEGMRGQISEILALQRNR